MAPENKDATKLMLQRIRKLIERVPNQLDSNEVVNKFPVTYENSLNNVLRLEVSRYNQLIGCIHSSLEQLEKALKGKECKTSFIDLVQGDNFVVAHHSVNFALKEACA